MDRRSTTKEKCLRGVEHTMAPTEGRIQSIKKDMFYDFLIIPNAKCSTLRSK